MFRFTHFESDLSNMQIKIDREDLIEDRVVSAGLV